MNLGHFFRQNGATLPIVLALATMLPLLALTQMDLSTIALRAAAARRDRLIALMAADSGLLMCARLLQRGAAPVRPWNAPGEPAHWRTKGAFRGPTPSAFSLAASWPGASAAPQCLVEEKSIEGQDEPPRYLLTVRGVGARLDTQFYLQSMRLDCSPKIDSDTAQPMCGWRSVAAQPN